MAFFPRTFANEPASFGPLFRLLEDFESHHQGRQSPAQRIISPKFDVKELADKYELHGEFPGLEQSNISLEFTDPQTLTVRARQEHESHSGPEAPAIEDSKSSADSHQPTVEDENAESNSQTHVQKQQPASVQEATQPRAQYHVHERSVGEYYRQFSFPGRIDQDAVSASMKNGILSVIVPKAKKHEARKININ